MVGGKHQVSTIPLNAACAHGRMQGVSFGVAQSAADLGVMGSTCVRCKYILSSCSAQDTADAQIVQLCSQGTTA